MDILDWLENQRGAEFKIAADEIKQLRASREGYVPVWKILSDVGQVKSGDRLRFKTASTELLVHAEEVLFSGTDEEEIIYNKKKNYYFITSLAIAGKSHAKNVEFISASPIEAVNTTEG